MGAYIYGRTVSEFVKRYRTENNMSQADLAKRLKVHCQYVSNVERGVYEAPPVSFCARFEGLLSQERYGYLISLVIEEEADHISSKCSKKVVRRHKS